MSLDAFAQELSRLRIADKYHAVVLELSNGEVDRLKTIKPEDFMGKEDAEGFKVSAPVARELVRQFRLPQQPGSPRMRDSLKRKDFDLTEYKQQWFDKEWTAPEWPRIQKSAEFEAKFNRFFKDHDLNGDGSINGHEVVGFMDKLSDLLAENYGTWKTVEEIRIAVQWNLDRNFDGEITKAEADEFLELLRMGDEELVNVRRNSVPAPRATAKNEFFENEFKRLWSKHDDDGSGTISGGETVAFMDDLTDLLLQTYATDESRSPRSKAKMRQQVQNDLDGDGNGNITRAEAEAFIFRRAAGSALQQTA
jgi:Ca2+-binding EF-hand superfamily protein